MAETQDIDRLIAELRGQIKALKQMLAPDSDRAQMVTNVETELNGLETSYAAARERSGDLVPIRTQLEDLERALSRIAAGQSPSQGAPRSRFERAVAFLGQSAPGFGIIALGLAFLFTIVAVSVALAKMGASSWQTIPGGRAVLLLALTFAFVTYGGTLLVTPFFSEGSGFDERFRRAREIFLLFAGMFTTIVGFYFASANNPFLGASLLIAETFNAAKGELQVAVAGGKSPYTIEVEYGEKGAVKKKPPESLENPGTVQFTFAKESDWPSPILIKVKDSADAKAEHRVVPGKDELISAGFKELKQEQKPGAASSPTQLAIGPKFDPGAGTVEVEVRGGKPPYKVEAIYGKDKTRKSMPDIAIEGGNAKLSFNKNTDWPSPLLISVKDSEGKSTEQPVPINEALLTQEGFKSPQ
jgi:hypothetical protein